MDVVGEEPKVGSSQWADKFIKEDLGKVPEGHKKEGKLDPTLVQEEIAQKLPLIGMYASILGDRTREAVLKLTELYPGNEDFIQEFVDGMDLLKQRVGNISEPKSVESNPASST